MLFAALIDRLQESARKRALYKAKVAEINALTARDLNDLRGDRSDMLSHVWQEIYGQPAR